MATCYKLEIVSEVYTSLWLTQKSFNKQHAEQFKKQSKIDLIDGIFRDPHVSVMTYSHVDNFNFVVGCPNQWKIVSSKPISKISEGNTRPSAMVVLLSPTRQHSNCHLSEKDLKLLDIINSTTENTEEIVYLVKSTDNNNYETDELEKLSCEIQFKIKKRGQNKTFKKLFFLQDNQVPVRIGMCLLNSITCIIDRIHKQVQIVNRSMRNKLAALQNDKDFHIRCFKKFISKSGFEICNLAPQSTNCKNIKKLSQDLKKEIIRKDLLVGVETSKEIKNDLIKKICHINESKLGICLQKRKSFLRKNQCHIQRRRTPKYSSKLTTRSMTKKNSTPKGLRITIGFQTKKDIAHICRTSCSNILCRDDYKMMAKDIFTEILDSSSKFVKCYTEDEANFSKISDELLNRAYSLKIHEWKTVAMRNVLVKGFGCVENNIFVYLKNNDEDEKIFIYEYLTKYLGDPPGNYQLQIIYKERKITLFSKLEQGSKINIKEPAERADEPRKYGSLGMFLEDKHGKYFFTTCAHVIGKEEHAYSPDDNSTLGQNVYINYSECNENDKNDPYIDFSLVQVSPERTLTCTFGLKTTCGKFINGRIFRGDLSEVYERTVYKWGATAPYLRKGKCIGFEDEGSLLFLLVDTKDFAKGGDSGAIVCVGDDVETGLAAFVIVAGSTDDSSNPVGSYLVYKVSDALDRIDTISGMTPCLNPHIRTISISSLVSNSKQAACKRKTTDDI